MHERTEGIHPRSDPRFQVFFLLVRNDVNPLGIKVQIVRPQFIASNLFLHKTIIRLVVVKGFDHIITITPGVTVIDVGFIASRVGITNDIEPVSSPAFTIMFGFEQVIDQPWPGIRRGIIDEGRHLLGGGWQADEIEIGATDECSPFGLRSEC